MVVPTGLSFKGPQPLLSQRVHEIHEMVKFGFDEKRCDPEDVAKDTDVKLLQLGVLVTEMTLGLRYCNI